MFSMQNIALIRIWILAMSYQLFIFSTRSVVITFGPQNWRANLKRHQTLNPEYFFTMKIGLRNPHVCLICVRGCMHVIKWFGDLVGLFIGLSIFNQSNRPNDGESLGLLVGIIAFCRAVTRQLQRHCLQSADDSSVGSIWIARAMGIADYVFFVNPRDL